LVIALQQILTVVIPHLNVDCIFLYVSCA